MTIIRTIVELPFLIFEKSKPSEIAQHIKRAYLNKALEETAKELHIEKREFVANNVVLEISPIFLTNKIEIGILKICVDKLFEGDGYDREYYKNVADIILNPK